MHIIHQAWNLVKPSTVSRCFAHCGFTSSSLAATDQDNGDKEIREPIIIEQLYTRYDLDFLDYVSADDDLETSEPLTDDAIIGIVQQPADESETEAMTST